MPVPGLALMAPFSRRTRSVTAASWGETRPARWCMKALRRDLVDPMVTEHEGRIVSITREKCGSGRVSRKVSPQARQPIWFQQLIADEHDD